MRTGGVRSYADIPGWFRWLDKTLFDAVLTVQQAAPLADLVDLGTYFGRSTVVIGAHRRPGERTVAVDLFGVDPGEREAGRAVHEANRLEIRRSYATLRRETFEANVRAVLGELPTVVQDVSSRIGEHVGAGTVRLVHVDASHLWQNVRLDAASARRMLTDDGVVVFSDYRSEHTPGVAAAVWEAVGSGGLHPFALSGSKFYGTYGDPAPYAAAVETLARGDRRYRVEVQDVAGFPVVRVSLAEDSTAAKVPPGRQASIEELQRIAADIVAQVRGGSAVAPASPDTSPRG